VPHRARPALARKHPVHVVLRVREEVWNLRSYRAFRRIHRAFVGGCERFGFRLIHYSVQGNHLHMIAEACDARALSRGMQGLAVRLAKSLNKMMGRRGAVLADRYFARALTTPWEVKAALHYVLNNHRRHAYQRGRALPSGWVDPFSSAWLFDGWAVAPRFRPCSIHDPRGSPQAPPHIVPARTPLLVTLWRYAGLLHPDYVPGA
jgi:REP element-mobilizing transposase RayT